MYKKVKKEDKKDIIVVFTLVAIVILILGFFIFKPSITGFAVITKETTYSDNLDLVVNESKNVIWNLRNPGDLKLIRATGAITRNGSAKVYIEKGDERLLIFDSTKQLFDVNVEVLPDYKKIFRGDELLIQIVLFNLRGFGSADVNVKYSIKDPNGNIIATEEEIVAVETQAKFVRKLLIPADLKPNTYVAFVEVKTPDGLIGTSSDLFEVAARYEEKFSRQFIFLILGIVIVFIVMIIILFSFRLFKKIKMKEHILEIKGKVPKEKIQKLEKELAAIQSAYKSKFISEKSYKKDKERLEKKLQKLRKRQTKKEISQEEVKKEDRATVQSQEKKPQKSEEKMAEKPNKFMKDKEKTAEDIIEEVRQEDEKKSELK